MHGHALRHHRIRAVYGHNTRPSLPPPHPPPLPISCLLCTAPLQPMHRTCPPSLACRAAGLPLRCKTPVEVRPSLPCTSQIGTPHYMAPEMWNRKAYSYSAGGQRHGCDRCCGVQPFAAGRTCRPSQHGQALCHKLCTCMGIVVPTSGSPPSRADVWALGCILHELLYISTY